MSFRTSDSVTRFGTVDRCSLRQYVPRPFDPVVEEARADDFSLQPEFYSYCHTKADYDEVGPSICRRTSPVFIERTNLISQFLDDRLCDFWFYLKFVILSVCSIENWILL